MTIALIETELALAKSHIDNFNEKGTKAACVRSRAHLMKIKKLCDELRKSVLAEHKAKPKKTRAKATDVAPVETK